MTAGDAHEAVEEVARTSYGRLVAYLASRTGDLAGGEDAMADAFEAALRTWPAQGVPDQPSSWMLTAARRSMIGRQRRADTATRAQPTLAILADERADVVAGVVPDKRLELLYACAHPAIDAPRSSTTSRPAPAPGATTRGGSSPSPSRTRGAGRRSTSPPASSSSTGRWPPVRPGRTR